MTLTAHEVRAFEVALLPGSFEVDRVKALAVAEHWRAAVASKPAMFDGEVLLGESAEVSDGVFRASCRKTRFSTFMWLRAGGYADWPLLNIFGAAVVVSADGAALLGRMAPHTSNAGQFYFPCGTPDPGDIVGETVDIEGSIARELEEETGLAPPVVRASSRRIVVMDDRLVACLRRFDTDLRSDELLERCCAYAAREVAPELDEFVLVRDVADLTDASPNYVRTALESLLGPRDR